MPLTIEDQKIRREKTIAYLVADDVSSEPIKNFIEREFKYENSKGEDFYTTHPVKDYKDVDGQTQKAGSKSSLTLDDYRELSETGFEADILFNHAWERKESNICNYEQGLSTISWNDLVKIVDTEKPNAKKLVKPKAKPKPPVVPTTTLEEDATTRSEITTLVTGGYNNNSGAVKRSIKKIEEITALAEAILQATPTYFDDYNTWISLGFLIYNETNGSEEGCDCFIALSLLANDSGNKKNDQFQKSKVSAQYHQTQKGRDRKAKLQIASLKKWLKEENPDSELLLISNNEPKKSGEMTANEIRQTSVYLEYRAEFENTHFKLNNPTRYCEMDNGVLLLRDTKTFCETSMECQRFL
ncbi:hypothetical protein B484DRAFT_429613 [Ochromonadaceae sp. CCMP2298]|nr:hypothetical protein B484DRAFT_429613 [Ochromonadaceae sp. CCMP2298]